MIAKKREHVSLRYMPLPTFWFKLQPHVTDLLLSRLLCRVRAGDVGLVNRRPDDFGKSYKLCPFCLQNGSSVASAYVRRVSGLRRRVRSWWRFPPVQGAPGVCRRGWCRCWSPQPASCYTQASVGVLVSASFFSLILSETGWPHPRGLHLGYHYGGLLDTQLAFGLPATRNVSLSHGR